MILEYEESWLKQVSRVIMSAPNPRTFVAQYLSPLFFRLINSGQEARRRKDIGSEEQFWNEAGNLVLGDVSLKRFRLTDWFPRAPGVYWSRTAREIRENIKFKESKIDAELGKYFSPRYKTQLIEGGGIGTIRLRPRMIAGVDCWLATALTGDECHGGIPLAIPDTALRESGVDWGDQVNIQGRVRFLQDADLDDTAASVHHARPLIVFVDKLKGIVTRRSQEPVVITPVALFESSEADDEPSHSQYTFIPCEAGSDAQVDAAADWIEKYATKHAGRVITNFDEQRPVLAGAPLSYQRLVAKTYDRAVIQRYQEFNLIYQLDQLNFQPLINIGDMRVGHNIHVEGSAIINIDATLDNVTQTIGAAAGLDSTQKSQLEDLVQSLKTDLDKLKASHADEAKEIAEALDKAVTNAAKPQQDRKKNLLQLSANGLKEAAELVKDIAPNILKTADLIAKFIGGL